VRNLQRYASSITRVCLAAFRAAMLQVHQNLKGFPHDIVRFATGHIDNKADAAAIVFELGIVQSVLQWYPGEHKRRPFCQVGTTLSIFKK
jgi:hypothetical protein